VDLKSRDFSDEQLIQFRSETTKKLFDAFVDSFIEDYMVKKYPAEKSGWRTLAEIAQKTHVSTSLLYGKNSTIGPTLDEPFRRGLLEKRIFPGERGRGGEVVRIRIAYERDPIRVLVSQRIRLGRESQDLSLSTPSDPVEEKIAKVFSEALLFSTLQKDQIRKIIQLSEKVSFSPNEIIIGEGDVASCFFIIVDGQVEVKQRGKSIRRMGRGQFFGETSLAEQETRSADVIAIQPTMCLKLSASLLKESINIDPQIAVELLQEMIKRNRGITRDLQLDE
jgi:Cyclic nucleotide-binding domain